MDSFKPSFQQPHDPESNLIANGWIEQYRRSKMRTVWKEVLASLVEGQHPGEETTLWIQRETINPTTLQSELEPLHQIPVKVLESVSLKEETTDNQFHLRIHNSEDDLVFRCVENPVDSLRWVQILKKYQTAAKGGSHQHTEEKKETWQAPDLLDQPMVQPQHPSSGSVSSGASSMTIRELRAICHGAGVNTAGMERGQLERAAQDVMNQGTYFHQNGAATTQHQHYTNSPYAHAPAPSSAQSHHSWGSNTSAPAAPPSAPAAVPSNARLSVKELRAICHGAGISTVGMERPELEAAAEEVKRRGTYFTPPTSGMYAPADDAIRQQEMKARQDEMRRQEEAHQLEAAAAEERRRRAMAEEESRRKAAELEKRRQMAAADEERRRKAEEEARRRQHEMELRRRAEEEARRKAAELEQRRRAEEEARRRRAEEEARRKAVELEQRRRAEEDARRRAAEEHKRRMAAEQQRQQHEAQLRYQQQQAAWKKQQEEAERQRQKAERDAAETRRRQQEAMGRQQQWGSGIPSSHPHHQQRQQHWNQQQQQQHPPPPPWQQPTQQSFHPQHHQPRAGVPPQQPHQHQNNNPTSPASQKYAAMANQNEGNSQATITRIKHDLLIQWALQPPQLHMLKPIDALITTIHNVFPPALGVSGHAYFRKWKPIVASDITGASGLPDDEKLKKSVRKIRFFLHPDKLPRDLNEEQQFMTKMLWDVTSDAWEEHEKRKEELGWVKR